MMRLVFIAYIALSLFFSTEMKRNSIQDGNVFMGAMFFAIIIILFNGFAELSMTIAKLPVLYKQRDLLFYPSWAYALPSWIVRIPISFSNVFIWIRMTYYVIGFDPNIQRMFRQYLLLL